MKILLKFDWNILSTYINNKFIVANKHPNYDLWILNYTPTTQFEGNWNDITRSCRGLVINKEGSVISFCLSKFYNIEELKSEEIPNEPFEITEKMDGSYISMFFYNNEWIFTSRGSFASEQAIMAKKLFNDKYKNNVLLDINYTYILELIGIDNKIVINYPKNDLILLTCFNKKNGQEISIYSEKFNGFNRVKKYEIKNIIDLNDLKKLEESNKEGFVVRFLNGFRLKIKFLEYIRLHKIVTGFSNIGIWERLKEGKNFDEIIKNVPDEWYQWLRKNINLLQNQYNEIERLALKEFVEIYYTKNIINRKDFAIEVLKSKYSSIIFNIYSKKHYDMIIWKMTRPKFCQPFKDGYENL